MQKKILKIDEMVDVRISWEEASFGIRKAPLLLQSNGPLHVFAKLILCYVHTFDFNRNNLQPTMFYI